MDDRELHTRLTNIEQALQYIISITQQNQKTTKNQEKKQKKENEPNKPTIKPRQPN